MTKVVRQLDHIIIRTEDAGALFELMSRTFGLPVAWPLKSYPAFESGGVTLGNVNLEILSCGPRRKTGRDAGPEARLCAIVYEAVPLAEAEARLSELKIPHTPVVPYMQKLESGEKVEIWANVLLGRLLGRHFWLDSSIVMSRLPGAASISNAGDESRLMRWQFDKLFSGSFVFLVEYAYQNFPKLPDGSLPHWAEFKDHDEKRAHDSAELDERGGGPLGLLEAVEVVAGVRDYEAAQGLWRRFLGPEAETAQGVWKVADGPAVRVIPSRLDRIQSLVLRVSSLKKAETFLSEKGMLGGLKGDRLVVAPGKIQGLELLLTE